VSKVNELLEKVRDSEAFQQLKTRYDELDSQAKLYVNLGALAAVVLFVFLSLVISMAKLNGLKTDINDREETIGYLERSADTIRQLRQQQTSSTNQDTGSPLPSFVQTVINSANIDPSKVEIGSERQGTQDKENVEVLVDVNMKQVNLRQVQRFLFALTEQGSARALTIKDLDINTNGDPKGWMDAVITVSSFKAKQ
jgi:hypothetical protein